MPEERVIRYIADWLEHFVGERTGEISIPEMQEFLYQHGYELVAPDDDTHFTAMDYWHSVVWVTKQKLNMPDRVVQTGWKE